MSRVQGNYYATSHLCTHYKAPLIKGSINAEGSIICPWHGACFSAKTGDIEEAPALDPLVKHQVKLVGNDVVLVTTEEALQRTSTPALSTACSKASNKDKVTVIVGGGAGGLVTAETLRKVSGAYRLSAYPSYHIFVSRRVMMGQL